jgi:hypothetical protein
VGLPLRCQGVGGLEWPGTEFARSEHPSRAQKIGRPSNISLDAARFPHQPTTVLPSALACHCVFGDVFFFRFSCSSALLQARTGPGSLLYSRSFPNRAFRIRTSSPLAFSDHDRRTSCWRITFFAVALVLGSPPILSSTDIHFNVFRA